MDENYSPRQFQDAYDDDDDELDPIFLEEREDITETLHIDPQERKEQLDALDDEGTELAEDTREELEDRDQET